jgi:hypothetical protein
MIKTRIAGAVATCLFGLAVLAGWYAALAGTVL